MNNKLMKAPEGIKKVTKATVKKAIKESGYQFINFNLDSNNLGVELETALEDSAKGNEQVKEIVSILETYGNIKYVSFKTGYGALIYRFNAYWTATDELIRNNID